jgi:hypothetical protein
MVAKITERNGKKRYWIDGVEVTAEAFAKALPDRDGPDSIVASWQEDTRRQAEFEPIHSEAVAVHPKRRKEAMDDARKKGVPTEVDSMGRIVFRTRQHRRAYLKAYGFHDNNSFGGD